MRTRAAFLALLLAPALAAQTPLERKIARIARDAHGKVSVACSLPGTGLRCDLNPHAHPPMQSVFKLPLAVTVLHQVEEGRFSLDQPIRFLPEDRILPRTHSELQDKYPNADVEISLRELLRLADSLSDNAATEVLLRIAGGPAAVTGYIASIGVVGFHLEEGERLFSTDASRQYRNWFEPAGAVQLLERLGGDSPLTLGHTALLLGWCRQIPVQPLRLAGNLPAGTPFVHKSGSSGFEEGMARATNDIGLVTLPDGRKLALAVFVTDSTAKDEVRDKVIARIGRAVFDVAPITR